MQMWQGSVSGSGTSHDLKAPKFSRPPEPNSLKLHMHPRRGRQSPVPSPFTHSAFSKNIKRVRCGKHPFRLFSQVKATKLSPSGLCGVLFQDIWRMFYDP